jgi:hypothetical protein
LIGEDATAKAPRRQGKPKEKKNQEFLILFLFHLGFPWRLGALAVQSLTAR